MRKLLTLLALSLALSLAAIQTPPAAAQSRGDLSGALERLQNNPRYQGRVIGTQVRRTRDGAIYEVQILRPNDRVIVVYINPATGRVVGDSGQRGKK